MIAIVQPSVTTPCLLWVRGSLVQRLLGHLQDKIVLAAGGQREIHGEDVFAARPAAGPAPVAARPAQVQLAGLPDPHAAVPVEMLERVLTESGAASKLTLGSRGDRNIY